MALPLLVMLVCLLSEIDRPTSHDQQMPCMIYDTTQLVGHSGELLNDNTAFKSRFGGNIYQNKY